jgi:hypothetical protein
MQLTTMSQNTGCVMIFVQIYRIFWTTFKLSKAKSLRLYKLSAFDLPDVKNGRFQRAVVYRVFICPKKYLRQLKACLLKSQLVEACSIWSFIPC